MPDSKYEDRLKDYTDVKERITLFYAKHPDGRLVTDRVEIWQDDDTPRVFVRALAYRSPDDPYPGTGCSWMVLPGNTNFTRGSEVENTETSAWGRAIGCLGIGIQKSIGSVDEIANKEGEQERKYPGLVSGDPPDNPDGSIIGVVYRGKGSPIDMELRAEVGGAMYTGFALKQGRQRLQVVATGDLATVLAPLLPEIEDQVVTVWGTIEMVPWRKGDREMPPYKRLQLARIQTPEWVLPATIGTVTAPLAVEPPTVPLFPDEAA